jgi:hypothetical protein
MDKHRYLSPHRLEDVLAALQFFASYPDYDLTIEQFRDRIAFNARSAGDWGVVLDEHSEFFRKSAHGGDYSLVLRRARPGPGKEHHRHPELDRAELSMLIETAIHLQKHELEMVREQKSKVALLVSAVGILAAFLGTLLGAWIKSGG